ncbi:MAG TPA: NAD(P)-dependent oxidoreductase [Phycisphaerae bacterium]|nr:NAD(P)-dependent oxidoreductase [Phycisphaerae bacterium]
MKLAVDDAIWSAPGLFAPLGEVSTFAGRNVSAAQIANADALVVRSVTRVDERLLAGSRVRFVGTASSGADHIDTHYLAAHGIAFADAAGCNSRTVAEYVLAALLHLARRAAIDLAEKTLGVVGVGRIGSLVAEWGESLGMRVLLCDPPKEALAEAQRRGGAESFVSFDQIAAESDAITLHVPLTRAGSYATIGMVNAAWLARVKRGAILINTSRGEVVEETALLAAAEANRIGPLVLDVWRGEPAIDPALARAAAIATPHVAGYSLEARRRAALMIRERLAEFLGEGKAPALPVTSDKAELSRPLAGATLADIALQATGLVETDRAMREWIKSGSAAGGFDAQRARCVRRREFSAYAVENQSLDERSHNLLRIWGFRP